MGGHYHPISQMKTLKSKGKKDLTKGTQLVPGAVVQSLLCLNPNLGFFLLVSAKILDTDAWLLKPLSAFWGQAKGPPDPLDVRKHVPTDTRPPR